jgi:hypothetical protein
MARTGPLWTGSSPCCGWPAAACHLRHLVGRARVMKVCTTSADGDCLIDINNQSLGAPPQLRSHPPSFDSALEATSQLRRVLKSFEKLYPLWLFPHRGRPARGKWRCSLRTKSHPGITASFFSSYICQPMSDSE